MTAVWAGASQAQYQSQPIYKSKYQMRRGKKKRMYIVQNPQMWVRPGYPGMHTLVS